jgi:hypothetical protein
MRTRPKAAHHWREGNASRVCGIWSFPLGGGPVYAAIVSTITGVAVNVAPRHTTAFGPIVTISLRLQPIVVR